MPKVTIVIMDTTGKQADLAKCLDSISKQTYSDYELLLVTSEESSLAVPPSVTQYELSGQVDLAKTITLAKQHANGQFVTFMQARDFIFGDDALANCLQEVDKRDVDLGMANLVSLADGNFYLSDHQLGNYGLINTNNLIPYMRFYRAFRNTWGLFINKELLEKLATQNQGQRVLYQAVHLAKKAIIMQSKFYCLVEAADNQVEPFRWQTDYEYSEAKRLVSEIRARGYQAQIPKVINVALCIDDNLVKRLVPLIYSLAKNNRELNLYLVYYRLSSSNKDYLRQLATNFSNLNFHLRKLTKELHQFIEPINLSKTKLPVATYTRVLLPHILPEIKRIIYLDTDTQVLASLEELWQTDLEGNFLGAAGDNAPYIHRKLGTRHSMFGDQGDNYFNSGVLLMDLELMRQYHVAFKVIKEALDTAQIFVQADQDAHNLYYYDAYKRLDLKYNYGSPLFEYEPYPLEAITILHHYVYKPWKAGVLEEADSLVLAALNTYYQAKREADELLGKWPDKISVIVDLRQNERANLKRCLGGLLYQSYTNLEILVLTKGTLTKQQAEFLAELQPYHRLEIVEASQLKEAVAKASGAYVYFLNINDLLLKEDVLAKFYQVANKGADLVASDYQRFDYQTSKFYWINKDKQVIFLRSNDLASNYQRELGELTGWLVKTSLAKECLASGVSEQLAAKLLRQEAKQVAVISEQLWLKTFNK